MQGASFSRAQDLARFIKERKFKILNLCHIPEDGRLKTLSFTVRNEPRTLEILDFGERVDGSSLFSGIEAGESDVYIRPRVDKSFINPFTPQKTINVLCEYLDCKGEPLDAAPQTVLNKAQSKLAESTGIELQTFAELEFYVISRNRDNLVFAGESDRNYHESAPFALFENLRNYILTVLENVGISTKYGHSEVGRIIGDGSSFMEQHEVEFLPESPADMADTVAVAKWVVRNVCAAHGVSVSFSPKVALEHAGTGMHVHLCALRIGKNIISDARGELTNNGLQMIGGILNHASSLSAFANPLPVSYLRFIARKESPMGTCWSARNRMALIRIPLWWNHERRIKVSKYHRETFEYRGPDPLANPHLLFGGLVLSVRDGLEKGEESLKLAKDLHGDGHRSKTDSAHSRTLPHSCSEAADSLQRDRRLYEAGHTYPEKLIQGTINRLRSYSDRGMWEELLKKPENLRTVLARFLDCG
jgi:glutamine synthetase